MPRRGGIALRHPQGPLDDPRDPDCIAKALDCDYKNVREDVKALKRFGLIHRVKRSVRVPFDSIPVGSEIRLAAPEPAVLCADFCRFAELGE